MNQKIINRMEEGGIINAIILIIIAIIILGYFKIDLRALVASPYVKDNLNYVWQLIVAGYDQIIILVNHTNSVKPS